MITANTTNEMLNNAGMDVSLDENTLQSILKATSPQLFSDALRQAANDIGARNWLTRLFEKVDVQPVSQALEQNTSAPTTRPAQQNKQRATTQAPVKTTHQNTTTPTKSSPERDFRGHNVYGSKAALYMALDETRTGIPTLRLEGAMARGVRDYDWDKKISIQLTQQELPHVAAVLFSWVQGCEYKNHGPAKNKGFKLTVQKKGNETGLFVNIMEANKPLCAIPVSAVDLFYLRNLAMEQLAKHNPTLDSNTLLSSLKTYANMLGGG